MICKNCNTEFQGNFCPNCGAKAEPEQYQQRNPNVPPQYQQQPQYNPQYYHYTPQPPKKSGAGMVVGIVALVVGAVFLITLPGAGCLFCCFSAIDAYDSMSHVEHVLDPGDYTANDVIKAGDFTYTLGGKLDFEDEYEGTKADKGYCYLVMNLRIKNISSEIDKPEFYLDLFADGEDCEECADVYYDACDTKMLPGKTYSFEVVYEIPINAERIALLLYADDRDTNVETQYNITIR